MLLHPVHLKGCEMGTLFVLVSPCFRENVVVTCKIVSFFWVCNLDNLLQKNVIVFFSWKSNFKMALIWKKGNFLHFLVTREKLQKFLQHISHSHTCILLTVLTFFALPILKKNTNLSGMVSLWYESWCWFLLAPFCNNQQITKWWAKFKLKCLLLICVYTNAKFLVICKLRTLNDGGEESVQYRNRRKHCFLAAAILLFIGKIIITWQPTWVIWKLFVLM